ncbi:hypothetical protein ATANTOWER_026511 [Ataeniobius toweri]|uniref:Secreted protein n=1 Tax=Ataeniobius toweri TaxID=208326 RepID=A0ABU7BBF5_9TELE|nr:hypothetical protein [Ataeniobius toweri]
MLSWAQVSCFLHRFEMLSPMGHQPLCSRFSRYPVGWFGSCNGNIGLQWLLWIQDGLSAIFRAVGVVRRARYGPSQQGALQSFLWSVLIRTRSSGLRLFCEIGAEFTGRLLDNCASFVCNILFIHSASDVSCCAFPTSSISDGNGKGLPCTISNGVRPV